MYTLIHVSNQGSLKHIINRESFTSNSCTIRLKVSVLVHPPITVTVYVTSTGSVVTTGATPETFIGSTILSLILVPSEVWRDRDTRRGTTKDRIISEITDPKNPCQKVIGKLVATGTLIFTVTLYQISRPVSTTATDTKTVDYRPVKGLPILVLDSLSSRPFTASLSIQKR